MWERDFMSSFPPSFDNVYILIVADYVSKWVEAAALLTNYAKAIVKFLQNNIFTRFEIFRAIISDERTHFCNRIIVVALIKHDIKHKITTIYHP